MKRNESKHGLSGKSNYCLIIGFTVLFFMPSAVAKETVDPQALIKEISKSAPSGDKLTVVWWIPKHFWQAGMKQVTYDDNQLLNEIMTLVEPYTIVAALDSHLSAFGGSTFKSEHAIHSSVRLKDSQGRIYKPLERSKINTNVKNLLQMLRPLIGANLGQMGQNIHFVVFPAKDKDGSAIANPIKEGRFAIIIDDKEFMYRLPLGSVMPPKYDPVSDEKFPGNYNYNPFTGTKLVMKKPT